MEDQKDSEQNPPSPDEETVKHERKIPEAFQERSASSQSDMMINTVKIEYRLP